MEISYKKFCELLERGENQYIDFKIKSNVLNKSERDNAEFLKDIIAFSNNGNKTNFLLIGVSDDKAKFESVDNLMLLDRKASEKIINLCKENIQPIPVIDVFILEWPKSKEIRNEHQGKKFVVIKIGPQRRQCFRFSKDYINYKEGYAYRRNQVWVRRGSTSDLATPEEIKLLIEGKEDGDKINIEKNDYERVPNRYEENVIKDLIKFFKDKNIIYKYNDKEGVLVGEFEIKSLNIFLLVIVLNKVNDLNVLNIVLKRKEFSHGVLIISKDAISSKSSFKRTNSIYEKGWGYFSYYTTRTASFKENNILIPYQKEVSLKSLFLIIDRVKTNTDLFNKLDRMIKSIDKQEDIFNFFDQVNSEYKKLLKQWYKDGCPLSSGYYYGNNSSIKLKKDEYLSPRKYPNMILKNQPKIKDEIQGLLKRLK